MQITNNITTIELDEQKILDIIIDPRIDKIERTVKNFYCVRTVNDLTPVGFNIFIYLCIIVLNNKRTVMELLQNVYDLSEHKIMQAATEVFERKKDDKQFNCLVYKLWINYHQSNKKIMYQENVA
jgi:CDP-glycerol glycerophosphotransferase (TagB/SpsB family)